MSYKRIAVIRGGPSFEYDISMATGKRVLESLRKLGYFTRDIVISQQGEWIVDGYVRQPELALQGVDVAFLALHGAYGEDGTIQRLLERQQLPFTGSRSFPSAIAFNKSMAKDALSHHGVLMPPHRHLKAREVINPAATANEIAAEFGPQYIIKPVSNGSSVGTMFIKDVSLLPQALVDALTHFDEVLVEEYIRGREATCGVLEGFRNEPLYALPTVEIVPPDDIGFLRYDIKYAGLADNYIPARFSYHEKAQIEEVSRFVHEALGLSQYSRSDFVVRDGKAYFLEVNTLPGLTEASLYPKALEAVGSDIEALIVHLINTASHDR